MAALDALADAVHRSGAPVPGVMANVPWAERFARRGDGRRRCDAPGRLRAPDRSGTWRRPPDRAASPPSPIPTVLLVVAGLRCARPSRTIRTIAQRIDRMLDAPARRRRFRGVLAVGGRGPPGLVERATRRSRAALGSAPCTRRRSIAAAATRPASSPRRPLAPDRDAGPVLPVHRPREPHLERHLRAHRLRAHLLTPKR